MAKVWKDRVAETTATTGTGTITGTGAIAQHQGLSAIGTGNTCDYCILSGNNTDWETGQGTVTVAGSPAVSTLSRDIVYDNSVGGSPLSPISLTGTSTVFCTATARRIAEPVTRLFLTSNHADPGSGAWGVITWQAVDEDPLGAFSAGTPTYVTAPSGVSQVRVTFRATWTNVSFGIRYLVICPPGGLATPYYGGDIRSGLNETLTSVQTPWANVTGGSTQIACYHNRGTSSSSVLVGTATIGGTLGGATAVEFAWR